MFTDIENLKIINILRGTAKLPSNVNGRKINSFIFRTGGICRYDFSGEVFDVHPGEVMFLPKGAVYSSCSLSDAACEYVCIHFEAHLTKPTPSKYSYEDFTRKDELLGTLTELWKFGSQAEQYKCYSLFYDFLVYISNIENLNYADKKKANLIAPAIAHIKSHIYDADLKTDSLHQLCGISGTYFRKIFISNFGTNPQSYILNRRLSHAKAVLDSGDFDSIAAVALSVGYADPLYFSRVFKKRYGMSPSDYIKNT